jgi:hypothetical protein
MNTEQNSKPRTRPRVAGLALGPAMHKRRHQMIVGVTLVALGVAYLANRDDPETVATLWHYWPFVLAAFGIANMLPPTHGKQFVDGLSQVLFAAWFYVNFEGLWGMSFGNSWPLLIIVVGAGMVLQPIAARYLGTPAKEEA